MDAKAISFDRIQWHALSEQQRHALDHWTQEKLVPILRDLSQRLCQIVQPQPYVTGNRTLLQTNWSYRCRVCGRWFRPRDSVIRLVSGEPRVCDHTGEVEVPSPEAREFWWPWSLFWDEEEPV